MRAEQFTPAVAHHGEAPVWITGVTWPGGLYWVDLLAGDVLHLGPTGTVERRHVGTTVSLVRPRSSGGLVYAVDRRFAVDDGPGSVLQHLPELWTRPGLRLNDGGCDPAGSLYCGAMTVAAPPGAGAIYRLAPDGSTSLVERGWTAPNGLEWSPDGAAAYHVDTAAGRIDVWSWNDGRGLHDRRRFVTVDTARHGSPDGLTVDAEGGVWVAFWDGSCVRRYDAAGKLSAVIDLPVARVTACIFGGAALDLLLVTTSRHGRVDPEGPAGAVFAAAVGVRGVPARPYAG